MKKRIGLIIALLFNANLLFAQGKFVATASKSQVGVGEPFEVDFTMNGGGTHFVPPDFHDLHAEGPNIGSTFVDNNGTSSMSITYSYIVTASKEGTFTINAAAVVIDNHTLTTAPLKIKVKGQAPPQAQQVQTQAAPDADADTKVDTRDLSKLVFIRAVTDKNHAYVGEQIKVFYKLYVNRSIGLLGGQPDKAPDLNGFWNQEVEAKGPNTWKTEIYKGVRYSVTTIKQSMLFPQHAGDLSIDPLSMTLGARVPYKGAFDNPFGNFRDVRYQAKSQPVIIHAIALPTAGKPADFNGAVGNYTVYSDVDKKELKANETINYTLDISGTGNLNLLTSPKITTPVDVEKYDPKTNDHIVVDSNGVSGSRQFSYLLIPRHEGNITLPPIGFTFFNPASGRYVTIPTKAFSIKVDKGDAQANVPAFNSSEQQDIKLLGTDVRYIKTSLGGVYKNGEGFYNSAWYYLLLLLGPVLFVGALFYRRWNEQYNSDIVKVKSREAGKMAAKHLAFAQKELTAGNKAAFYDAIAKGLYGYISDKLNIPVADLNRENIDDKLKARALNESIIKQMDETLDLCEMARFSPITGISQQDVFDKAKNIINEIEDKI